MNFKTALDLPNRGWHVTTIASLCWLGVWLSIGTVPHWPEATLMSHISSIRSLIPVIVFCLALFWLLTNCHNFSLKLWSYPVALYCLILIAMSLIYGSGFSNWHLAISMLAALLVVLSLEHHLNSADDAYDLLVYLSTITLTAVLFYFSFKYLSQSMHNGILSGYLNARFEENIPLPTGLARTAACCLILYYFLYAKSKLSKPVFSFLAAICVALILFYQSRGTYVAAILTLITLGIFAGQRRYSFIIETLKVMGLGLVCYLGLLIVLYTTHQLCGDVGALSDPAAQNLDQVVGSIASATQREYLPQSFSSGRIEDWKAAFIEIQQAPFFGRGAQADRLLLDQTASNMFIYALLCSGLIGAGCLFIGLFFAAGRFLRVLIAGRLPLPSKNARFYLSLALLSFLSFRGMFESGYAVFSIDYLLMLPTLSWVCSRNFVEQTGELSVN